MLSTVSIVKDGTGDVFIPSENINEIGDWNESEGYLVHSTTEQTLTIEGQSVISDTPISLSEGWNVIPYYPTTSQPVEEALSSISSELVIVKDYAGRAYLPAYDVNEIGNLHPGQGYKVYVSSSVDLVYDSGANAPMTTATSTDGTTSNE